MSRSAYLWLVWQQSVQLAQRQHGRLRLSQPQVDDAAVHTMLQQNISNEPAELCRPTWRWLLEPSCDSNRCLRPMRQLNV